MRRPFFAPGCSSNSLISACGSQGSQATNQWAESGLRAVGHRVEWACGLSRWRRWGKNGRLQGPLRFAGAAGVLAFFSPSDQACRLTSAFQCSICLLEICAVLANPIPLKVWPRHLHALFGTGGRQGGQTCCFSLPVRLSGEGSSNFKRGV